MLQYKEIFLGGECNNACLYCSAKHKTSPQSDFPSVDAAISQRETDSIAFYGGEPTVRRDIFSILHAARRNGYRRIKLFTNGRAFADPHYVSGIFSAGCALFEIKLWASTPFLHDHITRVNGSFRETVQGLANITEFPHEKFVCIRIPVCRDSLADLENTVTTALNFGINRIILSVQDYSIPFGSLMPHIANSLNISIFNRVWILTEGIPFCIMRGLEPHIGELLSSLKGIYGRTFQHHNACVSCIFREICPGVEAGYLAQFGDRDFAPVTATKYTEHIRAFHG